MEDKEHERYISQQSDNTNGSAEQAQVPSWRLPTVLHRLSLPPEQARSEVSLDDGLAKLKSENWEERAAAVRTLGRQDTDAFDELLVSALDDRDGSVRAAAVQALGKKGKR